jgi:hypothetical protein
MLRGGDTRDVPEWSLDRIGEMMRQAERKMRRFVVFIGSVWGSLGENKDQIGTLAQIAAVVGGMFAFYQYIIVDRAALLESQRKAADMWIANADAFKAVDDEWDLLQGAINERIGALEHPTASSQPNAVYQPRINDPLLSKINLLPVVLETCVAARQCDESIVRRQFCRTAFEWGMIKTFGNYSYTTLANAIKQQRDRHNVNPLGVFEALRQLSDSQWMHYPEESALASLVKRCNNDEEQKQLYTWFFDTAFDPDAHVPKPSDDLLGIVRIKDFAPQP